MDICPPTGEAGSPLGRDPSAGAGLTVRVIATVLPRGGKEAVRWLVRTYGAAAVRDFVVRDAEGMRTLPEPDRRLWLRVLAPGYPEPGGANRWRRASASRRRSVRNLPGHNPRGRPWRGWPP